MSECFHPECTPLRVYVGLSGRDTRIGRLNPPFQVHEADGSVSIERYCLCASNELGRRRVFLNGGPDAALLTNLLEVMKADAADAPLPEPWDDSTGVPVLRDDTHGPA